MIRPLLGSLLAGWVVLSGCTFDQPVVDPPVETPRQPYEPSAVVNGVVLDPEYFMVSALTCADPDLCFPPYLVPTVPYLDAAVVASAQVSVLHPGTAVGAAGTSFAADAPTGYNGGFNVRQVLPAEDGFVYLHAEVPDGALPPAEGEPFPRDWNPDVPPYPVYPFLPTTTVSGVDVTDVACFNQRANVIGSAGIVEAVAMGLGITVADLMNPALYGGLLIWVNTYPNDTALLYPLFGSQASTDVGDTYQVTWFPPDGLTPGQSQLGFIVDPSGDPLNSVGITATVLPPTTEAFTPVTITSVDPADLPDEGRPFSFLQPKPIKVRPGEVTYGENMATFSGSIYERIFFGVPLSPEFCLPWAAYEAAE